MHRFGKLQCPYIVNVCNTAGFYNHQVGPKQFVRFSKSATMDFIVSPESPMEVGNKVQSANGGIYELTEKMEERPAKGDYSFFQFAPNWQRFAVRIVGVYNAKDKVVDYIATS